MVALPRPAIQTVEDQEPQTADLKWASVVVREIVEKRLPLRGECLWY